MTDIWCDSKDETRGLDWSYVWAQNPDFAQIGEKDIVEEATKAHEELKKGLFSGANKYKIYSGLSPLFELNIKGKVFKLYEHVFEGEVAQIYKGTFEDKIIYLKLAIDPADNHLIDVEYEVLSKCKHSSLPCVEQKVAINGSNAILMQEVEGITLEELMTEYPNGVPAEHVMWMLERILSIVGFLHYNFVVHGNIKPENLIVNKSNHNVTLLGFSYCIPEANTPAAHYKIKNDGYTAPEVSKTAVVSPASDIYSIGKLAIKLLGGDIVTGGMPPSVDERVQKFIREMASSSKTRPNDAWKLWHELTKLRTEVYGPKRFLNLE
jgi:serine/threonine protein kinase